MAVNENGKLILYILQDIGEPATVAKIVSLIKGTAGEPRHEIKECVEETLDAGIRYGFLQRKNRKYYAAPVDEEAPGSEDEESDPEKSETEVTDMDDRISRRRRRSRSRRRRSRSRRRR